MRRGGEFNRPVSLRERSRERDVRNISKKIEVTAHISIIVVAILVSVVLVKNFLLPRKDGPNTEPQVAVGTRLSVPGVDWARNGRTLMVVLSTNCRFCTASAPLYQQIAQERAKREDVRMIAVFPQTVEDSQKYLNNLGVVVDEVKQVAPAVVGAKGTPTLILIDGTGTVQKVWVGKLPPDKESEVLNELRREG